ncbi:MAG: type III-A CRISPR-associated protein Cas10/Csm1 [Thermodesulfobacteriota bacterium]
MDETLGSVVLAGLLHDVGKFMQRAHQDADLQRLHPQSAALAGTYCPSYEGRSTHLHVLWTDAFFEWLKSEVGVPAGIDLALAQKIAVAHHRPDSAGAAEALAWILAEADRLSAGMDRREDEVAASPLGFRKKPLISPLSGIDIGRGSPCRHFHRIAALLPEPDVLYPGEEEGPLGEALPEEYRHLWQAFLGRVALLRDVADARHYLQGLQSQLEGFTWCIPSSTVDLRDISLYDHAHTTAAIASALHAYHESRGSMGVGPVRDRSVPAYRLVVGDLSGIQRTLFQLASQGARGAAKVLRARSFLLGAAVEAASLRALDVLGLPWVCRIQGAGGRFLLLAPALADLDARIDGLRRELDEWMLARHHGGLSLCLAAGRPFTGHDFVGQRFSGVLADVAAALDEAKQRPLPNARTGVLGVTYPEGACPVCERRPCVAAENTECAPCAEERGLGRRLPEARYLGFAPTEWARERFRAEAPVSLPGGMSAVLLRDLPQGDVPRFHRLEALDEAASGLPRRRLAQYLPRFEVEGEWRDAIYAGAPVDEDLTQGALKTFEHLACLSREPNPVGSGHRGKRFLAVLKADVDHLGLAFSSGFGDDRQSLSRYAGVSRLMDFFFSAHLPWLVQSRPELRHTYTVYSGGDDLLLVGPWRQTLVLAEELREAFGRFAGHNPNLTFSAAVLHSGPNQPLRRVADEAARRLDEAKDAGRDRVWLFGGAVPWADLARVRKTAQTLVDWVDQGVANMGFIYRLLRYARMARAAESDPSQAIWRAHLAYDLKRNLKKREAIDRALDLVGLAPDLTRRREAMTMLPAAVHWAVYRLRS